MIHKGLWGVESEAQELAHQVVSNLSVTAASVALWDSPNFSLRVKGFSAPRPLSTPPPVGVRIPLSTARWHRHVFERKESVLLHQDSLTQAMPKDEVALSLVSDLRSISLLPIVFGGEVIGVLGLGEMRAPEREPLTREKVDRCNALIEKFIAASAHAWEVRRLLEQARAMSCLLQISQGMLEARSFGEVLNAVISSLSDWLGAPVRGVLLVDQPPEGFKIVARWNLPETMTEEDGGRLLLALARACYEQCPVCLMNVAEDPLDPLQAEIGQNETWTRICLPLMEDERLFGIACLYVGDELRPTAWELDALRRIGEVVGVGMGTVTAIQRRDRL